MCAYVVIQVTLACTCGSILAIVATNARSQIAVKCVHSWANWSFMYAVNILVSATSNATNATRTSLRISIGNNILNGTTTQSFGNGTPCAVFVNGAFIPEPRSQSTCDWFIGWPTTLLMVMLQLIGRHNEGCLREKRNGGLIIMNIINRQILLV